MLKVLPIQTKDEQKAICDACNIEFKPDMLVTGADFDFVRDGAIENRKRLERLFKK